MFEIMRTVKGYGRIMLKKFIVSGLNGNLNDKKVMTVTALKHYSHLAMIIVLRFGYGSNMLPES